MGKPLTASRKRIINKLVLYFFIIIVVSAIPIYLDSLSEDYEKKQKMLEKATNDLNSKLLGFNKKSIEFSNAVIQWEKLTEANKRVDGLRINDAKETLEKLKVKYKLSSFRTTFSKPEEIIGDYKTDTVVLVSSIVSLSFNALSDEFVYNFISDLTQNFPGMIQIKTLSISKPTEITKDIVEKISKGEEVTIVPVTIDFYWHDLRYIPPKAPIPAGGVQQK